MYYFDNSSCVYRFRGSEVQRPKDFKVHKFKGKKILLLCYFVTLPLFLKELPENNSRHRL